MAKSNEKDPDLMKATYYFSGYVKSTSYESIADAMVEVNTGEFNSDKILKKTTTTDKKGYFKIRIPTNARKPRFVLNIWKEGYGLFSQIFFRGKQNGIWLLTKGTIHTIDPSKDNTIRDTPHITKYTGPLSSHIDISKISYRRLLRADKTAAIKKLLQPTPSYLDPQVIHGIRNKGIQVTIKADTLVGRTDGRPPNGDVKVTLATVDILGLDSMPGDFTAAFKDERGNDQIGYMIPYGAASVDVRSLANGEKYQLKTDSKVKIEIPLPKHLEGSKFIPKTIPFLEYNKEKGIWEKIGEGTFNENTQVYTATTTQFSSFNMDILRTDQACLVIDGRGINKDYKLQVDFFYNDRSWTKYRDASANEIYALYGLPPDVEYTLTAYKTDLTIGPLVIDCTTCTPELQNPSFPLNPDPDPNFTFPACHHSLSDDNPVILSAARPDQPTKLCAEYIGCNYIDLYWEGSANDPAEGYIIKVYTYVGDPDPVVYKPSYEDIRLRVEGLNSSTTYYFHIHQYDEYAEEYSKPYPDPDPLAVLTWASQDFYITNEICGQQITQVYFNGGTDNQLLPTEGINHDVQHKFSVCQRPDSIQVKTALIEDPSTIIYSFDFINNSVDSISVMALVKILPGLNWKYTNLLPPFTILKLVFQPDETFSFYDDNIEIDRGTYQEEVQNCDDREIDFAMYFANLTELKVNCTYYHSTDEIEITQLPISPPVNAVFEHD